MGEALTFTFQYGSTLMVNKTERKCKITYIYIPIWFYFNNANRRISYHTFKIYIPIWFYFNRFHSGTVPF